MTGDKATLTLKIGDREVRYEARREAVDAQLEHLVGQLLRDAPSDVQVSVADLRPEPEAAETPPEETASAAEPDAETPLAMSEEERLKQLFATSRRGHLMLRKLPEHTADALLLVLYGMWKVRDVSWVSAPGMTISARVSGARFERADRLLAKRRSFIEGTGQKRARRYRLTRAGREHCERLVESLTEPAPAAAPAAEKPPPKGEAEASRRPKPWCDWLEP